MNRKRIQNVTCESNIIGKKKKNETLHSNQMPIQQAKLQSVELDIIFASVDDIISESVVVIVETVVGLLVGFGVVATFFMFFF